MLEAILRYLRRRERANINRELDHVYADMREVREQTRLAKLYADQVESKTLDELEKKEKALIANAKKIDAQDLHSSIPTRSARAW